MNVEDVIHGAEEAIRRVGWHAMGVFPTKDSPGPAFTYTTGFRTTWGHPDVIISALSPRMAHAVLVTVAGRIADEGRVYEAGEEYDDVLQGFPVRFGVVSEAARLAHMTMCGNIYGRDAFEAVQMIWPDARGKFPGEDGYRDVQEGPSQQVLFSRESGAA